MNDPHPPGPNGGFRPGALSPEELDKFAALFVPTWEQAIDIAPPPAEVLRAAAAEPIALAPAPKTVDKKTMMGIAAPVAPPPEAPLVPPQRAVDPHGPTAALDLGVAQAKPAVVAPKPISFVPPPSIDDAASDFSGIPRKRSPLPYVIGGVVLLGAIGIFFATRGGETPKTKTETAAPITESKKLDLPDPNLVTPTTATAAAPTTTTTTTAAAAATTEAPTATAEPAPTVTETKTAEPPPKATAAPKPPPVAPPPKTVAAPKPPPATTAKPPAKKSPQKIKDEF